MMVLLYCGSPQALGGVMRDRALNRLIEQQAFGRPHKDAIDPKATSISFGDDERPKRPQTFKDSAGN
jgi:hypothetical protein